MAMTSRRSRAVLTEMQVVDIFRLKFPVIDCSPNSNVASLVASKYGVNEKTVRDIWKGRTWRRATGQAYAYRLPSLQGKPQKPYAKKGHAKPCPIRTQDEKRVHTETCAVSDSCCTNKLCRWSTTPKSENDSELTSEPMDKVSIDTLLHLWDLQEQRPPGGTDPFGSDFELLEQVCRMHGLNTN